MDPVDRILARGTSITSVCRADKYNLVRVNYKHPYSQSEMTLSHPVKLG